MIRISDFSENTKRIYRECKKGERAVSDLIETLIDSDFDKSEIKQFVRKHYKSLSKWYEERYEL